MTAKEINEVITWALVGFFAGAIFGCFLKGTL